MIDEDEMANEYFTGDRGFWDDPDFETIEQKAVYAMLWQSLTTDIAGIHVRNDDIDALRVKIPTPKYRETLQILDKKGKIRIYDRYIWIKSAIWRNLYKGNYNKRQITAVESRLRDHLGSPMLGEIIEFYRRKYRLFLLENTLSATENTLSPAENSLSENDPPIAYPGQNIGYSEKNIAYPEKNIGYRTESESESETEAGSEAVKTKKPPPPKIYLEGLERLKIEKRVYETLKKAYPEIDIEAELKKADAWMVANPKRPKKNHAAFFRNWLSRIKKSDEGPSGIDDIPIMTREELDNLR